MRHLFFLIAVLISSVAPLMITAKATGANEQNRGPYTLDDIIAQALTRNPALAGAASLVEQSRGQQVTASAYHNPLINGSAGRGSIRDPSTGVSVIEHSVTVQQPLEWPATRAARQRAAAAGVSAA